MRRDKEVTTQLQEAGWIVLRFWEWQIRKHLGECVDEVKNAITSAGGKERSTEQNADDTLC